MPDQNDSKRQNPRWPGHRLWTEEERQAHRQQRDALIRDAGLEPANTDPAANAGDGENTNQQHG